MLSLHRKNIRCHVPFGWRRGLTAVALFCLLSLLLFCVACAEQTDTGAGTGTSTESFTDGGETGTTMTPDPTVPTDPYPGDASAYDGVMIAAVYGPGNNPDAPIGAGFVQLYNAADHDISLSGATLYYKSDGVAPYRSFDLPAEATIPSGGYYLVRTSPVADYDASMAVMGMEFYDATWDISLDNKEIRLLLAPSGWYLKPTDDLLVEGTTIPERAISSFVATYDFTTMGCAVDDLTKNKVAVRTALTDYSGFHTVNLTRCATDELRRLVTRTSDGRVNEVVSSRLEEVHFSHAAGVYVQDFDLTLTAGDGYTVYYTLDGSDPTVSHTRKIYTQALPMTDTSAMPWGQVIRSWNTYFLRHQASAAGYDSRFVPNWYDPTPARDLLPGAHVIKAYATNGATQTPVYTNTYFVNSGMSAYQVPVVSLSLPTADMIGSSGFYSSYMALGGRLTDPRPRGTGMMEVFTAEGVRVGHSMVEMAVSGNGSAHGGMKSLRIYYKGALNQEGGLESHLNYDLFEGRAVDAYGNAITTFDRLLLRNAGNDSGWSHLRDPYMQRISAELNIDTMASTPSLVFINGEFWGVYNIRERYSPEYVESHYGVDKDNVTVIESDYEALVYRGNAGAPYVDSAGVSGQAAEFNTLYAYIMDNDMSDAACYQYVSERIDLDSFVDLWAIRLYLNARDWPENNIKIWRNTNPDDPSGMDTKWHFVLLDLDMGMSYYPTADPNADTSPDSTELFKNAFKSQNTVCGRMMNALLQNAEFRLRFILRFYELATEHYTPDGMQAALDEMRAEWKKLLYLQSARWPGDSDGGKLLARWNEAAQLMDEFIAQRPPHALHQLYTFLQTSEQEIENAAQHRVVISFDERQVAVTVNGVTVANGETLIFPLGEKGIITVVATPIDGHDVSSVEWVEQNGTSTAVQGSTAIFTIHTTGAVIIHSHAPSFEEKRAEGSIVAGTTYLFYLSPDGDLYAWGDNRHGVLGVNLPVSVLPTPTFVMGNVAKVETSRGTDYEDGCAEWMTAIVTKDGKLYTVGVNTLGQLGRNGIQSDNVLGLVPFDRAITDVSVGHDHTLVLDADGVLWGVGSNTNGQMGGEWLGSSHTTFCRVASNVADMAAGRRSTTYLTKDGKLYGLGDNRWNKLSEKVHAEQISSPVLMQNDISYIAAGEHQSVAVSATGQLYYAGWRRFSTFADRQGNRVALYAVMDGVAKADIFFSDMVILTDRGEAYVYGLNNRQCIGTAAVKGGTPKKVLEGVADVAAGYGFTAYLMQDGSIRVQGDNTFGQAGNGTKGGTSDASLAD